MDAVPRGIRLVTRGFAALFVVAYLRHASLAATCTDGCSIMTLVHFGRCARRSQFRPLVSVDFEFVAVAKVCRRASGISKLSPTCLGSLLCKRWTPPLDSQKRPRITLGAIISKVMTSVTRIPDLGLLVLARLGPSGTRWVVLSAPTTQNRVNTGNAHGGTGQRVHMSQHATTAVARPASAAGHAGGIASGRSSVSTPTWVKVFC